MSNHINNRISVVKNDKQEKISNPFLNPIKRENPTLNNEEKTNIFNSKHTTENSNKTDNRTDNKQFNNGFKERNYQNKNNNMFKNASNNKRNDSNNTTNKDNNFSLDNEEMFPSLGNNPIKVQVQVQDQETKPVLSYKTVSETQKTEINKNNEKTLKNGWLSLSKGQDISKIYKKEAELRNKRESMRALNELSKQRIEEIKASYEYNYIWNEEKRNEMLYGISKQETNEDNYSDDEEHYYADDDNYNYYNKKYTYDN